MDIEIFKSVCKQFYFKKRQHPDDSIDSLFFTTMKEIFLFNFETNEVKVIHDIDK